MEGFGWRYGVQDVYARIYIDGQDRQDGKRGLDSDMVRTVSMHVLISMNRIGRMEGGVGYCQAPLEGIEPPTQHLGRARSIR